MDRILNGKKNRDELLYYGVLVTSILGSWLSIPFNRKIYLFHILLALYSMSKLFTIFSSNKLGLPRIEVKRLLYFIGFWYLYVMVTFFWARSTMDYLKYFLMYTLVFYYLLVVIINNSTMEALKKTVNLVGILLIASVAIGILESQTSFRLFASPYMRKDFSQYTPNNFIYLMKQPTAFFHNPNNLATFVLFGIAFLTSYILFLKKKVNYYIFLAAALLLLYLTNSRANWIGAGLIFMVFVFMKFRLNIKKPETKVILVSVIGLMALAGFLILAIPRTAALFDAVIYKVQSTLSMITSLDFSGSSNNSTRFRWVLIKDAFRIISDNPFGVGAGNASYYLGLAQSTDNLSLHNWFLELWVDFGFHFFVLYMLFYGILSAFLYKCMVDEKASVDLRIMAGGCFMSQIGFIVAMMSPSGIVYFFPYWLLIGLSLSVINIHRSRRRALINL